MLVNTVDVGFAKGKRTRKLELFAASAEYPSVVSTKSEYVLNVMNEVFFYIIVSKITINTYYNQKIFLFPKISQY